MSIGFCDAEISFSAKLQSEQFGWSKEYAERVIAEYRKYFFLLCTTEKAVSPSADVDQAWHLHILYSHSYREWCETFKGTFIDHTPSRGGAEQTEYYKEMYQNTLIKYRQVFNTEPPADIWLSTEEKFQKTSRVCWVDMSKFHVIPQEKFEYLKYFAVLLIATGLIILALSIFQK